MKIWIDAHISPAIAAWINRTFPDYEAASLRSFYLQQAEDEEIFFKAREAGVVFITKDYDLIDLLEKHGPPPKIIWLRFGNTSNARLREIFEKALKLAVQMLEGGEVLVEVTE